MTHSLRGARRSASASSWLSGWVVAAALVVLTIGAARPCRADEAPSILGYGFEGLGTGAAAGLAVGYLSTGPQFESGEWKKLVYGTAIGALSGLGVGVLLGIIDAGSGSGRGVGSYMIRDSNYGTTVGLVAGGIIGVLRWIDDGSGKDLLRGMAWGTIIGGGTGLIVGALEGALRGGSASHAGPESNREGARLRLGVGLSSGDAASVGTPYPTLSGRF